MKPSESGTNAAVTIEATKDLLTEENDALGETLDTLNDALIEAEKSITKLEADRDEYRNLYHLGEAKIMSREAIIESLSETELAKDVTRLEAENERLQEWTDIESSYAHMFLVWMRLVKEHSEELYWELFDKACGHFDALLKETD